LWPASERSWAAVRGLPAVFFAAGFLAAAFFGALFFAVALVADLVAGHFHAPSCLNQITYF
jgi:hypothetical protein